MDAAGPAVYLALLVAQLGGRRDLAVMALAAAIQGGPDSLRAARRPGARPPWPPWRSPPGLGGDLARGGAHCTGCYALKLAGQAVPASWLEGPRVSALIRSPPICLLTSSS